MMRNYSVAKVVATCVSSKKAELKTTIQSRQISIYRMHLLESRRKTKQLQEMSKIGKSLLISEDKQEKCLEL